MIRRSTTSVIALGLALLAACSTTPDAPPASIEAQAAEARSAADRGDHLRARELYADLARRSAGEPRNRYLVEVARAEVALGNAEGALTTLASIPPPRPQDLEADMAAVRADALFALGRPVEAVRLLVEREIWLDSAAGILDNQERIWNGLARPESVAAANVVTGDTIIDGWLALAPLARQSGDAAQFLAGLVDWHQQFPGHPAAAGILAERLALSRGPGTRARRIALLLPLTGAFRASALAVLEGIFAAHFASARANETSIQVYDTTTRGSIDSYQTALIEGADFIVGPLIDVDVDAVQQQAGFLPTLALNISSAEPTATTNFFQYALSSDDEIEAIATRAIAAGHTTAIALHASDPRGYRLMGGFRQAFEARGGRIVDSAAYVGEGQDLSTRIDTLLNINASEQRYDRLFNDLGRRTIEFEPRRRADIDMIFLQASPAVARLLVPLLEGKDAADIAAYATSELYDPARAAGDPDLDGVIFPELPMLIAPVGEARTAADLLSEFSSPGTSQRERLFAFGFDAYLLAQALYADDAASWPIAGATGELYLGENGRVRRILPFAEFSGGRPRSAAPAVGSLPPR